MKRGALAVVGLVVAFYVGVVYGVRRTLRDLGPHEFMAYKAKLMQSKRRGGR